MPHVEINYTQDLSIDFDELFLAIETTINNHDSSAGICKCRAYPSANYRYTHILVTLSLLPKPHRDDIFTNKLIQALELTIKSHLKQPCYFSMLVAYNLRHYVTNQYEPAPSSF